MALVNCPECAKTVSETAEACPACGFKLTAEIVAVQKRKQKAGETIGAFISYGLVALFWTGLLSCAGICSGGLSSSSPSSSTPAVSVSGPISRHQDPRDARWDNADGRQVIRAFADEAGVSESEMRRSLNDEIDRRGLSEWADGR